MLARFCEEKLVKINLTRDTVKEKLFNCEKISWVLIHLNWFDSITPKNIPAPCFCTVTSLPCISDAVFTVLVLVLWFSYFFSCKSPFHTFELGQKKCITFCIFFLERKQCASWRKIPHRCVPSCFLVITSNNFGSRQTSHWNMLPLASTVIRLICLTSLLDV